MRLERADSFLVGTFKAQEMLVEKIYDPTWFVCIKIEVWRWPPGKDGQPAVVRGYTTAKKRSKVVVFRRSTSSA
jgi:hypothetical protein